MSISRKRDILHFSKNILRDGTHFTNVSLKLKKNLATTVNERSIIKAGTIVAKDGTKAIDGKPSSEPGGVATPSTAYGIVYEDIDVTYEAKDYIYGPVTIHGIVEEGRILEVTASKKEALKGIIFEAGPTKKADDFSSLEQ